MAPITTASDETNHMALLDKLDMAKIHKPFRNPAWKPPQRRNKNLKQILSEAQRREQQSLLASTAQSGAATPADSTTQAPTLSTNPAQATRDLSRAVLEKNNSGSLNVGVSGAIPQPTYSYTSIQAAPSLKPKRRYCDVTGLPARYQDPKTGLRYHNKEVYGVLKTLSTAQVQEYLAARGANTVLK